MAISNYTYSLLLYYVFYLRFSKHVLSAQRISIINEKVLCV